MHIGVRCKIIIFRLFTKKNLSDNIKIYYINDKNITANYSVTIFFIYDAVFFSYDTIFFIYDASFFLYDTVFFIYDASFFLYDAIFFIYDAVYFCLVMIFFLLDTAFFSFFAISVHFIAINGILSIIPTTHNAKFPHRKIIR